MMARKYEMVLIRHHGLTIEGLAEQAGMHPLLVEKFVELGLIEPAESESSQPEFDDAAVLRLLTIRRLRDALGINVSGVAVVLDLVDRLCALQRENERLRMMTG